MIFKYDVRVLLVREAPSDQKAGNAKPDLRPGMS